MRKLARDVRAEFQSKIGQTDLEEKLTTLFDYIANEQDIDFSQIMRVTAEIAKDVKRGFLVYKGASSASHAARNNGSEVKIADGNIPRRSGDDQRF